MNNLEAAVSTLTFKLKAPEQIRRFQLGVRSNIPSELCIRSCYFDNVIFTFTLHASNSSTVVYQIPPCQLIYFKTSKEKLEGASFEIIDLTTNEAFSLIDDATEPTLIDIAIRHSEMTTMQMLVDSSDTESAKVSPSNHNMNFNIHLPERRELEGQKWSVVVKQIQTTTSIWNIQDTSFSFKYHQHFTFKQNQRRIDNSDREKARETRRKMREDDREKIREVRRKMIGRTFDINTLHESNMSLPPGRYSTIRQVVSAINSAFARTKTPLWAI